MLSRPRQPIVADALALAREWCAGHVVDGAPALGHACKIALVLGRHVPRAAPELIAAGLLHDCPEYAPKDVDLDALLTTRLGAPVVQVVRGLHRERTALGRRMVPDMTTEDNWTLCVSAADKIVSLRSALRRADAPPGYWHPPERFVDPVVYFGVFHTAAAPHLPPGMAGELARLVVRAEQASARARVDEGGLA